MTVTKETEHEIKRLHGAEGWPKGTIASQVGVHEDVVTRVIDGQGPAKKKQTPKPQVRLVDPFVEFIGDTLKQYPRLCATR